MLEALFLNIEDETGLQKAVSILHDAVFQQEGITFDAARIFIIRLERVVEEASRIRRVWSV